MLVQVEDLKIVKKLKLIVVPDWDIAVAELARHERGQRRQIYILRGELRKLFEFL